MDMLKGGGRINMFWELRGYLHVWGVNMHWERGVSTCLGGGEINMPGRSTCFGGGGYLFGRGGRLHATCLAEGGGYILDREGGLHAWERGGLHA